MWCIDRGLVNREEPCRWCDGSGTDIFSPEPPRKVLFTKTFSIRPGDLRPMEPHIVIAPQWFGDDAEPEITNPAGTRFDSAGFYRW